MPLHNDADDRDSHSGQHHRRVARTAAIAWSPLARTLKGQMRIPKKRPQLGGQAEAVLGLTCA